jgi:hypothetical protein
MHILCESQQQQFAPTDLSDKTTANFFLLSMPGRVDNDNRFASFLVNKRLQTLIVFFKKRDAIVVISQIINFCNNCEEIIAIWTPRIILELWKLTLELRGLTLELIPGVMEAHHRAEKA